MLTTTTSKTIHFFTLCCTLSTVALHISQYGSATSSVPLILLSSAIAGIHLSSLYTKKRLTNFIDKSIVLTGKLPGGANDSTLTYLQNKKPIKMGVLFSKALLSDLVCASIVVGLVTISVYGDIKTLIALVYCAIIVFSLVNLMLHVAINFESSHIRKLKIQEETSLNAFQSSGLSLKSILAHAEIQKAA